MQNKMLSHAIILCGKQDLSEISMEIAKSFVCIGDKVPCNECKFCKKVEKQVSPDVITISTEENTLTVDEIRKMRRDVYILPNECEKKVYIIKDAEKLNVQAQNALLKVLEEPPRFVCFIIECENDKKIMQTLRSRCSIYRFNSEKEDIDVNLLEKTKEVIKSIRKNDELALLSLNFKTKEEFFGVLGILKIFLRDALILNKENCVDFKLCEDLISSKKIEKIYEIYDICLKLEGFSEFNVSVNNLSYYFVTELNMDRSKNWHQ